MAYHINSLGSFAGSAIDPNAPAFYADLHGFVPQHGDRVEDFTSRSGEPYDPEHVGSDDLSWDEWVAAAEAATTKAGVAAAKWQADDQ